MSALLDEIRRSGIVRLFLALIVLAVIGKWFLDAPGINLPLQRKAQTKTNISGLLRAIEGFHDIYGRLPASAPPGGELTSDGETGVALLTVLLGKEPVGSPMDNPKQIRFVNTEETRMRDKGGLLYSDLGHGAPPVGLYDPWGNPFRMRFAPKDGSGIQDPFQPDQRIQGKAVIVFSYGPNGKPNAEDDLKSW